MCVDDVKLTFTSSDSQAHICRQEDINNVHNVNAVLI